MTDKAMSVAKELTRRCSHLFIDDGDDLRFSIANALDSARAETFEQTKRVCAKELNDTINYHYDQYKNDCSVCGAMLSKCEKDCIIPDLLKLSKEILALPLSALDKEKSI